MAPDPLFGWPPPAEPQPDGHRPITGGRDALEYLSAVGAQVDFSFGAPPRCCPTIKITVGHGRKSYGIQFDRRILDADDSDQMWVLVAKALRSVQLSHPAPS